MSAEAKHTPLPWPEPEYDNHGNGSFHEWWSLVGASFTNKADAYLAWRAVNSHAELLEALKRLLASASPTEIEHPRMYAAWVLAISAVRKAERD